MKKNISLIVLSSIALAISSNVLAGRTPPCKEPGISRIHPDKDTHVLAGTEFSFVAARGVKTREIKVMIKGKVVPHKYTKLLKDVYKVYGTIPEDIPPGYASAKLEVGSIRGDCPAKKAWLMYIKSADAAAAADSAEATEPAAETEH